MKRQSHLWKQSGSIMLWGYTENLRNYPGWHFTADRAGCDSLIALLDAFAADGPPGSRTLTITAPTPAVLSVPNNRSNDLLVPSKFRLSFASIASEWLFPRSAAPAELSLGVDWLPVFRQSVAGVPKGKGDYSIGPRNGECLWFWWQPAAA